MNNEDYLRSILEDQEISPNQRQSMSNLHKKIKNVLEDEIGGPLYVYYGGSLKKDTMIKARYDLDLVIHWPWKFTLPIKDLYFRTGSALQRHWNGVQARRVGWQIPYPGEFHVDVVPAKYRRYEEDYANLYNRETGGKFRTSIKIQKEFVEKSQRQDVIRLLKLWKVRKQVPIKTFILEQMIIRGCSSTPLRLLEPQLFAALNYIANKITTIQLADPANPDNIITDLNTIEEKNRVQRLALQAFKVTYINDIFSGTSYDRL